MTQDQTNACEAFIASITADLNNRIQGLSLSNDQLTRDLASAQDGLNTANLALSAKDSELAGLRQQVIDAQNREMAGGADAERDAALAQVATLTTQNAELQARLTQAIADLQGAA